MKSKKSKFSFQIRSKYPQDPQLNVQEWVSSNTFKKYKTNKEFEASTFIQIIQNSNLEEIKKLKEYHPTIWQKFKTPISDALLTNLCLSQRYSEGQDPSFVSFIEESTGLRCVRFAPEVPGCPDLKFEKNALLFFRPGNPSRPSYKIMNPSNFVEEEKFINKAWKTYTKALVLLHDLQKQSTHLDTMREKVEDIFKEALTTGVGEPTIKIENSGNQNNFSLLKEEVVGILSFYCRLIKSVRQDTLNIIQQYKDWPQDPNFFINMTHLLIENDSYSLAEEFTKVIGLMIAGKEVFMSPYNKKAMSHAELAAQNYFNLATIHSNQGNYIKSVEYFQAAYEMNPNKDDLEYAEKLCEHYIYNGDLLEAEKLINKHKYELSLKDLNQAPERYKQAQGFVSKASKGLEKHKYTYVLVDKITKTGEYPEYQAIEELSYTNKITLLSTSFNEAIARKDIHSAQKYQKLLEMYIASNEAFSTLLPKDKFQVQLIIKHGNDKTTKKLLAAESMLPNDVKATLISNLGIMHVNGGNYTEAAKYMHWASECNSSDNYIKFLKTVLSIHLATLGTIEQPDVLQKQAITAEPVIINQAIKVAEKIEVNEGYKIDKEEKVNEVQKVSEYVPQLLDLDEGQDSTLKEFIQMQDPKYIHEIYQAAKRKALYYNISQKQPESGWQLPKGKFISKKDVTPLHFNLMAMIDKEKVCNSGTWQKYLDKGFAQSALGASGVKFLGKEHYEIKQFSTSLGKDKRLCNSQQYVNSDNEKLIVFDSELNHGGADRYVYMPVDIINCSSVPSDLVELSGHAKINFDIN